MEGNFDNNPAAGESENAQHDHNLRNRSQRNINNVNNDTSVDVGSGEDDSDDDTYSADRAAAVVAQPAAGGGSGSGGGNTTVKKKTGGARKKKPGTYKPASDGPPVPPNTNVNAIPLGFLLNQSDIKGSAKQKTSVKSMQQINSERADTNAQRIREVQSLYTQLHTDSETADADWKEYHRNCKIYEEYLKQKDETQRVELLEMKSKCDTAKCQIDYLKQQLKSTNQLRKGELDAKEEVIRLLKLQIKSHAYEIAAFREIEVTKAKGNISVETTRAKAMGVQEVKENAKKRKNENAKQHANMVQSSHQQMSMGGGGGIGMMAYGGMGGGMGGGMSGNMMSQHHVHHQNGNQQFDFMVKDVVCIYIVV